jgi:hypothetical protein
MQGVKDGNAVLAGDHRLAIQEERLGAQLGGGRGDGGISIGPVIAAAGEQANGVAVPAHDQRLAVVLDLVNPTRPRGGLGGQGRNAGIDEAVGADVACEHTTKIGALDLGRQAFRDCRGC